MALIGSLGALAGACVFAVLAAAIGLQSFRWLKINIPNALGRLLLAIAFGVVAIEVAFFAAQVTGRILAGVTLTLMIAFAFLPGVWAELRSNVAEICSGILRAPKRERFLAVLTIVILFWQGLAATAPLNGSDALHYHFAAPLRVLRLGFHPDFFLTHSFLPGQSHLLILLGLALGSEKLAMGLLWLGSVLAAASAARLARQWISCHWAWVAALAFLLNPVVFWQATASGSPDLWMAFFAVAGVLAIVETSAHPSAGLALLCGFLAGGIAGTKYTGCLIAASLFVAFIVETRALRGASLFLTASLTAGVWPYLRNLIWTGDPIFPFALRWIAPDKINTLALAALRADTGASGHRDALQLAEFPFFAAIDPTRLGFWELFGPLILALAPLFLLYAKRSTPWRVMVVVWLLASLAIGASSGMLRFLLPLLPLALAAAFAGAAELRAREWRIAWLLACASITGFLLLSLGGMAVYTRPAIAASVGLIGREEYLQQRSPDYAISSFVNRSLAGKEEEGRALVFFRHTYYLQVPYLNGDPQDSWAVDPARLSTPAAWRAFLRSNHIRWIVRAPDYPEEVAAPLEQLERNASLAPFAREDVATFEGMRILGVRRTFTATIFRVID